MNYYYGRLTGAEETHGIQKDKQIGKLELIDIEETNMYFDRGAGDDASLAQLDTLKSKLEKKDRLFVRDISALGASTQDAHERVLDLLARGVDIETVGSKIVLRAADLKAIRFALFASEEATLTYRRTAQEKAKAKHQAGMDEARRTGKLAARPHWRDSQPA